MPSLFIAWQFHQKWVLFLIFFRHASGRRMLAEQMRDPEDEFKMVIVHRPIPELQKGYQIDIKRIEV